MASWKEFGRLALFASKKTTRGSPETALLPRAIRYGHRWRSAVRASSTRAGLQKEWSSSRRSNGLLYATAVGAAAIYILANQREAFAEAPLGLSTSSSGRLIRLADIQEHNRNSEQYWVYRGNRVYDITEWIPNHPGGEVILRAVGGSIEPYWNIFTIHQKQEVYDILEQYFIGLIDPRDLVDGHAPSGTVDDPFKSDPVRDEALIERSSRPCNAETPKEDLTTFLTPNSKFYVRNHLWVPDLRKAEDAEKFRLTVEMADGEETEYSLSDLRSKFTPHTITATLQCSGNRRAHMTSGSRQTNGLQWDVGAISTATCT